MQEKYKELFDLKRSGLLEPSEEILFDALVEMKQRNGFQLCSSAYETEEADKTVQKAEKEKSGLKK